MNPLHDPAYLHELEWLATLIICILILAGVVSLLLLWLTRDRVPMSPEQYAAWRQQQSVHNDKAEAMLKQLVEGMNWLKAQWRKFTGGA